MHAPFSHPKEARDFNTELRAVVVLNAADSQGHDNDDAADALKEIEGLDILDVVIGRRKAFPNAAAGGRAVIELMPKDPKAIDELHALIKAV